MRAYLFFPSPRRGEGKGEGAEAALDGAFGKPVAGIDGEDRVCGYAAVLWSGLDSLWLCNAYGVARIGGFPAPGCAAARRPWALIV